jgi:L-2,4-diaminobutyrate decarboxylase
MRDWSFPEFEESVVEALRVLGAYVEESRDGLHPVVRLTPAAEIFGEAELQDWIANGSMNATSFAAFLENYLHHSTRMHHPGYLAHQVSVPDFPAALGDLVHGTIHNPMAIYEMGPSAAAVELAVLRWMLEKIGWGEGGSGVLTHGGSLANLTALLAARAAAAPETWENGARDDLVILAPPSCHYSVQRASSILGMGAKAVLPLEVDSNEVIAPSLVRAAIQRAVGDGKKVVALVANACATGTGLHDPLEEVGHVCNDENTWLHVDGAHGASALVSDKEKHLLRGVEQADSITWDAHKMLRTSGLCTGVLFREPHSLDKAFTQDASYIFYDHETPGVDLIHRTVECTKAGLGLKVFLNLAWRGEDGIARYVEEEYSLARRAQQIIQARRGFSCPYEPESNIVCFRYEGDDELQITIRDRLLAEGRFHISSTEISGRRYLRLTVINPQTTEETIAELLDAIVAVAAVSNP